MTTDRAEEEERLNGKRERGRADRESKSRRGGWIGISRDWKVPNRARTIDALADGRRQDGGVSGGGHRYGSASRWLLAMHVPGTVARQRGKS